MKIRLNYMMLIGKFLFMESFFLIYFFFHNLNEITTFCSLRALGGNKNGFDDTRNLFMHIFWQLFIISYTDTTLK